MKNWTRMHLMNIRLLRYHGYITPCIALLLFFLYSFEYIDLIAYDISFLAIVFCIALFLMIFLISRRDRSIYALTLILTMFSINYFILFIWASEPPGDFRTHYKPLSILMYIIVILLFLYSFRGEELENSKEVFNGEEVDKRKDSSPVLFWIDCRVHRIWWRVVLFLIISLLILAVVWFWMALEVHNLPEFGASFIGVWFFSNLIMFLGISVSYSLLSRRVFLQLREDGVYGVSRYGLTHGAQELVRWEDLENMEFEKVADINLTITRETGDKWIRGFTPNAMKLIEVIVKNHWYHDIELHENDIESAAVEMGMVFLRPKDDDLYGNYISSEWARESVRSNPDIGSLMFVFFLIFGTSILFSMSPELWMRPFGNILIVLSIIFIVSMILSLFGMFAIHLKPGKEVFDQTNEALDKTIKDVGLKYSRKTLKKDKRELFIVDLGRSTMRNPKFEVASIGEQVRVKAIKGSRKDFELVRTIMRNSYKAFSEANLIKPVPRILR